MKNTTTVPRLRQDGAAPPLHRQESMQYLSPRGEHDGIIQTSRTTSSERVEQIRSPLSTSPARPAVELTLAAKGPLDKLDTAKLERAIASAKAASVDTSMIGTAETILREAHSMQKTILRESILRAAIDEMRAASADSLLKIDIPRLEAALQRADKVGIPAIAQQVHRRRLQEARGEVEASKMIDTSGHKPQGPRSLVTSVVAKAHPGALLDACASIPLLLLAAAVAAAFATAAGYCKAAVAAAVVLSNYTSAAALTHLPSKEEEEEPSKEVEEEEVFAQVPSHPSSGNLVAQDMATAGQQKSAVLKPAVPSLLLASLQRKSTAQAQMLHSVGVGLALRVRGRRPTHASAATVCRAAGGKLVPQPVPASEQRSRDPTMSAVITRDARGEPTRSSTKAVAAFDQVPSPNAAFQELRPSEAATRHDMKAPLPEAAPVVMNPAASVDIPVPSSVMAGTVLGRGLQKRQHYIRLGGRQPQISSDASGIRSQEPTRRRTFYTRSRRNPAQRGQEQSCDCYSELPAANRLPAPATQSATTQPAACGCCSGGQPVSISARHSTPMKIQATCGRSSELDSLRSAGLVSRSRIWPPPSPPPSPPADPQPSPLDLLIKRKEAAYTALRVQVAAILPCPLLHNRLASISRDMDVLAPFTEVLAPLIQILVGLSGTVQILLSVAAASEPIMAAALGSTAGSIQLVDTIEYASLLFQQRSLPPTWQRLPEATDDPPDGQKVKSQRSMVEAVKGADVRGVAEAAMRWMQTTGETIKEMRRSVESWAEEWVDAAHKATMREVEEEVKKQAKQAGAVQNCSCCASAPLPSNTSASCCDACLTFCKQYWMASLPGIVLHLFVIEFRAYGAQVRATPFKTIAAMLSLVLAVQDFYMQPARPNPVVRQWAVAVTNHSSGDTTPRLLERCDWRESGTPHCVQVVVCGDHSPCQAAGQPVANRMVPRSYSHPRRAATPALFESH